jgi:hypothetical protein
MFDIPIGWATLSAGLCAIGAGWLGFRAINRQIAAQRTSEKRRREESRLALEAALIAELKCYTTSIAEKTSEMNCQAHLDPKRRIRAGPLASPVVFTALVRKIGLISDRRLVYALVAFYGNVQQINEIASEGDDSIETCESVAERLRMMAGNLAQALNRLSSREQLPIPEFLAVEPLYGKDGRPLDLDNPTTLTIQQLLLRLAGLRPDATT